VAISLFKGKKLAKQIFLKYRDCEPDRFRGQAHNKKYPVSKASPISKKGELKIRRPICYGRKKY
jgi:hypothetical protein